MPIEEIEGYNEFQRDVSKIKSNLEPRLQDASMTIAQEWVSAAQSAANSGQASLAAQSFGISQGPEGSVDLSNDSVLFFGSEFGGQARPETMQFPPHNGRRGFWFYPARRANDERFMEIWDKGVENAMKPWDRHG